MKPYRKEKLASLIQELVAESIAFELADPRITPLTSVSRVLMSDDLQVARVMISVPGGDSDERLTLQALQHARGHLQRLVGRNVRMRQTPEIRLEIDVAAKRARQTLRLIEENQIQRAARDDAAVSSEAASDEAAPHDVGAAPGGSAANRPVDDGSTPARDGETTP